MPHKRNPVLSENISGLSRLMRSYALAALEDVALWHERDISHSSVERVIAPDATILLDFMLGRFAGLIDKLLVYPERMLANLEMTKGVIFSQLVLLQLVAKGMSREEAYAIVQRNAMNSWESGRHFKELLSEDGTVSTCLGPQELELIFRNENFLKQVDFIFERIFGEK
jgi:adenylosuccinate lyase